MKENATFIYLRVSCFTLTLQLRVYGLGKGVHQDTLMDLVWTVSYPNHPFRLFPRVSCETRSLIQNKELICERRETHFWKKKNQ
jgi:hypothetical protein